MAEFTPFNDPMVRIPDRPKKNDPLDRIRVAAFDIGAYELYRALGIPEGTRILSAELTMADGPEPNCIRLIVSHEDLPPLTPEKKIPLIRPLRTHVTWDWNLGSAR